MTDQTPLKTVSFFHVRHAGGTAAQAAMNIANLLDSGVTFVDISRHDLHADTVTLRAGLQATDLPEGRRHAAS